MTSEIAFLRAQRGEVGFETDTTFVCAFQLIRPDFLLHLEVGELIARVRVLRDLASLDSGKFKLVSQLPYLCFKLRNPFDRLLLEETSVVLGAF